MAGFCRAANLIIASYDLADIERAWLDPGLEWA